MKVVLRRYIALTLCAIGLISAFFPFKFYRLEREEKAIVRIAQIGILSDSKLMTEGFKLSAADIEKYPALKDIFNEIIAKGPDPFPRSIKTFHGFPRFVNMPATEAKAFIDAANHQDLEAELFVNYKEHIFTLGFRGLKLFNQIWSGRPEADYARQKVSLKIKNAMQLFSSASVLHISTEALKAFPAIKEAILLRLSPQEVYKNENPMPSTSKWQSFLEAHTKDVTDIDKFLFEDTVFSVKEATFRFDKELPIAKLKECVKSFGILLIVLGLVLARSLYRVKANGGISLASLSNVILLDLLLVVISAGASIMLLGLLLELTWQTEMLFSDALLLQFVSAIWFVLGLPLCIVYVSTLSEQRLFVDKKKLEVRGLFSDSSLNWSALNDIELLEYAVPVGRGGFIFTRKAFTSLRFVSKEGVVSVLEPATASRKRMILTLLKENAPDKWQRRLKKVTSGW